MLRSLRLSACLAAFALIVVQTACGLPRDPEGTLERVRGGTLRVGFVVDTPWVTAIGPAAGGLEGAIVAELARRLGASVTWTHGAETPLLTALHDGDLDLVVAGLTKDSPWAAKASFTRPYYVDTAVVHGERTEIPHVVAVRPGENAWQVYVERVLESRKSELAAMRHAVAR
ncbi:MAG TPA: transporter substrate-binding domain-containing protein [Gemmatimonadaceae bacterium]|nr:transporter substrate-binding domain-containing protein [Gemmatimonadaceae bacterium]